MGTNEWAQIVSLAQPGKLNYGGSIIAVSKQYYIPVHGFGKGYPHGCDYMWHRLVYSTFIILQFNGCMADGKLLSCQNGNSKENVVGLKLKQTCE